MTWDSIVERIPHNVRPVKNPRLVGLIIMALEKGPASAEEIIDRLRPNYRYYPDKRKISAICSKFTKIFEEVNEVIIAARYGGSPYKVKQWKLRDDMYVMDGEIQAE